MFIFRNCTYCICCAGVRLGSLNCIGAIALLNLGKCPFAPLKFENFFTFTIGFKVHMVITPNICTVHIKLILPELICFKPLCIFDGCFATEICAFIDRVPGFSLTQGIFFIVFTLTSAYQCSPKSR